MKHNFLICPGCRVRVKNALWLAFLVAFVLALGWLRLQFDREIHRQRTLEVLEDERAKR